MDLSDPLSVAAQGAWGMEVGIDGYGKGPKRGLRHHPVHWRPQI